jgi:DNA-binding beta-propeller fold protein YncE
LSIAAAAARVVASSIDVSRRLRRCRHGRHLLVAVVTFTIVTNACGFAEPVLQPLTNEPLDRVVIPPVEGKTASFDIMAVDQDAHRLYVADSLDQGVDVVDISVRPGHYLRTIPLNAPPKGLTVVGSLHRLFTGNDDSTVSVIDTDPVSPHPYAVLATVSTNGKGRADLLDFDPRDHKLYVSNPDDGFLSAVDVTRNVVVGQIPNLGFIEQPRYDPVDGMVYVISSDRNSIFQIDAHTDALVREYPLPVICEPHGLAINPAINQGLIGCSYKDNLVSLVWDFKTKRVIRSFDLAGAGDAVIFDQKAQHFYFAAKDFTPPEVAVFNAAPITFLTAVPTSHHSGTLGYDEAHSLIYTYDGLHLEAALWAFPDPVAGCFGAEAQRAAAGASRGQTPHCHPPNFVARRRNALPLRHG